ncbi:hypothetical protein SA2016_0933 [Sinomonas atrocyanea]|uniref:Uncharacterized protein n=1 Tax=Sinomonas atrocyanea TaxID=37927 RepID=A0A126ZWQ2_9MICC|nr:hypothetical protein [Sinomonas atrocyanea]AMM31619.1 hypothetical protein SA2016_0933 [Sinomonas atrocyanea]
MLRRPFKHMDALAGARAEVELVDVAIAAGSGPAETAAAAEPDGQDEETRRLAGLVASDFPAAARGGGGRSGDGANGYASAQRRDLSRGAVAPEPALLRGLGTAA